MAAPTYDSQKSPVRNLQLLFASLIATLRVEETFETVVAQILHRIHAVALVLDGTLTVAGATTISGALVGGVQTLTGAGAVNLTTPVTVLVTTGADALTLADGTVGQLKLIKMLTDGGDGTLTPTNFREGTTITFNDANDSILLVFLGTEWHVVVNNGTTIA